jgi:hypothetical protein
VVLLSRVRRFLDPKLPFASAAEIVSVVESRPYAATSGTAPLRRFRPFAHRQSIRSNRSLPVITWDSRGGEARGEPAARCNFILTSPVAPPHPAALNRTKLQRFGLRLIAFESTLSRGSGQAGNSVFIE